jgi:hypothetical protein
VIDPDLLDAPLGDHRVLARTGPQAGRPLWILDPPSAAIWDATRAGLTPDEIAADWQLFKDDAWIAAGETPDAALTQTHAQLITAAGAADQRLLVLHAAGVSRAGQGILLIGQGGAGKTTLATALNAQGWALLSDDVVPVTLDGQLLGLGLGPCLKAGSWPVLAEYLPPLEETPVVHRADQPVRFPPPPGPVTHGPLPTAAFLIPHYRPGSVPAWVPLTPVEVLQAIIAAEAILPVLDQSRLNALAHWVSAAPGFALTYPDLGSALDLVAGWWQRQAVQARTT